MPPSITKRETSGMGLQITVDTGSASREELTGLARLLESVSPGVLVTALGSGSAYAPHTHVVHHTPTEDDHAGAFLTPEGPHYSGPPADLSNLPPPVAPTGAVPIPPAPPSGVASATPPAPAASPADRDVNGLPWDGRIHASTRVRNADGSWRAKRAVHPETVRIVEAELRQNAAAPAPAIPDQTPIATAPVVAEEPSAVPTPPAAPTPPPPPPAPTTLSGPQLFARYMERVTAAQTGGLVTTADVAAIATGLGLVGTAGLLQRPDLVPQAEASLDALLASRG